MTANPIHGGWLALLQALQTAGLAMALRPISLPRRLAAAASRPPEPHALTALLEAYYRGDGDVEAGLRRLRADRMVIHREGDGATARQLVARLRLACPEIGPLVLIEEQGGPLVLRTSDARTVLGLDVLDSESMVLDGTRYEQRTVAVRTLVGAANFLLSQRRIRTRFLPLTVAEGVEAYVGLEPADALVLDAAGLLDEPFDAIRSLAAWDRGPLIVYDPARRVA